MSAEQKTARGLIRKVRIRDLLAGSLGVTAEKKQSIHVEVSKSATVLDASYWLQVILSAGIAALGLALNSPAVIIGAMLISPLMGPILASGLALSSGDVILGLRAILNLALSCFVAILFSTILVAVLPFKEITSEIAARTQPNTLDFVIALFSGAVGSVAVCKDVKGVATSIPGVAIAVALMPPLCVVGYGLGVAVSLDGSEGMRVARGGGLLFLTNLVTITFSAMAVFSALHITTPGVREAVRRWRATDRESLWVRAILGRFGLYDRLRVIGGLPARFLLILVPVLIILIPLSQTFLQLRDEIRTKQQQNAIRAAVNELWEANLARLPSGDIRATIDRFSAIVEDGQTRLLMTVFTSKPYTEEEKKLFNGMVAARLAQTPESIKLELVEIPTATSDILARARDERRPGPVLTVAQLESQFWQKVESAVRGLGLPPPARLITYKVTTSAISPLSITLVYLSPRDIEGDATELIAAGLRERLGYPNALVSLERIDATPGLITFARNGTEIGSAGTTLLDTWGRVLSQLPPLRVELVAGSERNEREGAAEERARAASEYLSTTWGIPGERITTGIEPDTSRRVSLQIRLPEP